MDDLLQDVAADAARSLAMVERNLAGLARDPTDAGSLASALRLFHSVKGTCGFVGLQKVGALAHEAETLLDSMRESGRATPAGLLATLQLTERCRQALRASDPDGAPSGAEPVEAAWRGFPALVAELAAALGKRIALECDRSDLTLHAGTVRLLRTALVHLVRNAADHGLETPDARRARGKAEAGTIRIGARATRGRVVVSVTDDGRGFATGRIAAAVAAGGFRSPAALAAMTDQEVQRLAFLPGLTTAAATTRVSGRGVGLDAVQAAMARLGGAAEIASAENVGTTVALTFRQDARAQDEPLGSKGPTEAWDNRKGQKP